MPKKPRPIRCLDVAAAMPPRAHQTGPVFRWTDSEVAAWLCEQPEIRSYIFARCERAGLIVFDPESGLWHGRDWRKS